MLIFPPVPLHETIVLKLVMFEYNIYSHTLAFSLTSKAIFKVLLNAIMTHRRFHRPFECKMLDGTAIRGWLYETEQRAPALIMSHGVCSAPRDPRAEY